MPILRASSLVTAFLCAAASTLDAQESLHVLRFEPAGAAAANGSVAITFDHPVAPKLDASVRAANVVRVQPEMPMHAHWRDPSTLLIRFDRLWPAGSTYRVMLDARLRSADSLLLAASDTLRVVRVADASILNAQVRARDGFPDTLVRFDVLTDAPVSSDWLRGHAWLISVPYAHADTIPLVTERVRAVEPRDAALVHYSGMYDRDRRMDTLRRVVELVATRTVARGSVWTFVARAPETSTEHRASFSVRPPFGLRQPLCNVDECKSGPLVLRFTEPVPAGEIRAHVRVNGAVPALIGDSATKSWAIVPSLAPRQAYEVEVTAGLHSVDGERLAWPVREAVRVPPRPPSVAHVTGSYIVPADDSTLMQIRHVNTDSVVVIVARVRADQRMRALEGFSLPYGWARTAPPIKWRTAVGDSVVLRYATPFAHDTAGILAVPVRDLPRDWDRTEPVLLRAVGVIEAGLPPDVARSTNGVRAPGAPPPEPGFVVLRRSALALHVDDASGEMRVWLTSLRDTRSLAGAHVRLLDTLRHEVAAAMTDAHGMARLRYAAVRDTASGALLVEARHGDDVALLPLSRARYGPAPRDDDGRYYGGRVGGFGQRLHGAAFADRGIYRPGEAVYLKGIAGRFSPSDGYSVLRADSARWTVHRIDYSRGSERVWSHVARLSEFGTLVDTFVVPRTARLGEYWAEFAVRDAAGWHAVASTTIDVAEYRVPEFAVDASADTTHAWFARDSVPITLAARYLYGMPMQNVRGSWWARTEELAPWEMRVRGLDGWIVGRPWWMVPGGHAEASFVEPTSFTTGANGRAIVPVPVGALTRPGRVTVYAGVADANRQTITTQTTFIANAADVYVGVRLPEHRWDAHVGEPIRVQALVVDADGRRRAGTPIHVYALRYHWAGERVVIDTMWRTQLTSTRDTLDVRYTPTNPGSYELLLSARDARGRESQSSAYLWVRGKRSRSDVSAAALTVTLDKPRYAPGDTLVALVTAPDAGSALVTLSREGILSQIVTPLLKSTNAVRVVVPANAIPSATLKIFALRPTVANDTTRPFYRQVTTGVAVVQDSKQLRVTLTPDRARYQPRDTVRLTLRVEDHAGSGVRSELAVWALDEGVARLTAFTTPDALSLLLVAGGDPTTFATTLTSMVPGLAWWNQLVGPLRLRGSSLNLNLEGQVVTTAMGTAQGTQALRSQFLTTPFYRGAIVTDARGRADVRFPLPDNLTTFRLFAVAVDQSVRAGSADTSIVSARTLAVRAALPRVIREGDTLLAGAVLTQDRGERTPVSLRAEGVGVELAGAPTLSDTLIGRAPRELRFSFRGLAGDTATLRFFGRTPRDADAVEARVPVSPGGRARARVAAGTLSGSAQLAFPLGEALDTARSRLELQLGSTALPLVQRISESLRLYPYDCTEQITSSGRVLVARLRAEQLVHGVSPLDARDRARLERAVATLVQRQREDGGIGYWSASNWTTPWLTAYALGFLYDAQHMEIDVPASSIARAREYLAGVARRNDAQLRPQLQTGADSATYEREQLVAVMAMRRVGAPDTAAERHLIASRTHLDWVDRLTLAQLHLMRGDSVAARELVQTAWRATRREGRRIVVDDSVAPRYWMFRSISRPVSALLTTTAAALPDEPRLASLFESLIQVGRSDAGVIWNTIDQALIGDAVVAMLARPGVPGTTPVTVSSGTRVLATTDAGINQPDTIRVALSAVAVRTARGDTARVSLVAAKSNMPVYYAATLFEVPRARPVRADDEGISVERWYERYDDPTPVVSVREGELVRVRIRITVPADREFVVVDDPLPAGLEAVDLSLRTSAVLPPYEGAPRLKAEQEAEGPPGQRYLYGSWDAGWWTPWEHREIRDDRVLYFARQLWKGSYLVSYVARATSAGTFVRPPAHAEEMYNPALHGRSDGGWFTVTPVK